jgi:DNA ligase (NAD+)
VKNYADLYELKKEQIIPLERMAEKSAEKMIIGIEKSKEIPFEKVLFAFGIRYVGENVAKKLVKHYQTLENLRNATLIDLMLVDEIGERIAQSLMDFFQNKENIYIIERLKNYGLQLESTTQITNVSEILRDKTIVVSGVFDTFGRDELKKTIEDNGGKVGSSISSKTDFLLAGSNIGPAKLEKANQLGLKILYEKEFRDLINR